MTRPHNVAEHRHVKITDPGCRGYRLCLTPVRQIKDSVQEIQQQMRDHKAELHQAQDSVLATVQQAKPLSRNVLTWSAMRLLRGLKTSVLWRSFSGNIKFKSNGNTAKIFDVRNPVDKIVMQFCRENKETKLASCCFFNLSDNHKNLSLPGKQTKYPAVRSLQT